MLEKNSGTSEASLLRAKALSRWENEGGADADGHQQGSMAGDQPAIHEFTKNELANTLTRLIALENLVISLLSDASEQQLERVRQMAAFISPRPGATPHPLTIRAAAHMIDMVNRSNHFREQDEMDEIPCPRDCAGSTAPRPACGV